MNESGQEVALVNLSPGQAKEKGLLTSGTYGLRSTGTLQDSALKWSLANRLVEKLDWNGLGLYKMTWKVLVTSHGHLTFRLQASPYRISAKESTGAGWNTPTARDWKDTIGMSLEGKDGRKRMDYLPRQVFSAGWSTPTATDANRGRGTIRETDTGMPLPQQVSLVNSFGSNVPMENRDRLNPEFPCWLMNIPKDVIYFALSEIP